MLKTTLCNINSITFWNCMTWIWNYAKCYIPLLPLLMMVIVAGVVVIIARVKCREWKLQSLASWISEHTLANIIFWVSCAISLFFVLALYLSGCDLSKLSSGKSGQSIITGSIAMLGIITAAGALVMKYQDEKRNKADEERKKADEARKNRDEKRGEFSAALERLGSNNSAMSRVAGVYTLVEVADKYEQYREETVRVLCTYLRSDHSKDDPVIESVILESLESRCARDTEPDCQWSGYGLDLHGATILNPFIFTNCRFAAVNLDNATFKQDLKFRNCKFESLELKNVAPQKDLLLINLTTKEPCAIQLSGKTTMDWFIVENCQTISKIDILGDIDEITLSGACDIQTIAIWGKNKIVPFCDRSQIGSIQMNNTVTINEFSIQNCEITDFHLSDKSTIKKSLLVCGGSNINLFTLSGNSRINGEFTVIPSSAINDMTMRGNSAINLFEMLKINGTSSHIMEFNIEGSEISELYVPSNNAVTTFNLQRGHIKEFHKPKNLKIDDPHKVVEKFLY